MSYTSQGVQWKIGWAAVLAAGGLPVLVGAQSPSVLEPVLILMNRDVRAPSTGWGAGAPPETLPGTTTVLTRNDLSALRPNRVEDLAGLVPGMQPDTSSSGLSSAVKLRGFSTTSLRLDGMLDVQRLFARDLATVEQVEVLAGPSAIFHGVTTPGGVVNYVSKRPQHRAAQWAEVGLGQGGFRRGVVDMTGPLGLPDAPVSYRLVLASQAGTQALALARLPRQRQVALGGLDWKYGPDGAVAWQVEEMRNQTPYSFGTVITQGGDSAQAVQTAQVQYDRLYVLPGGAPAQRRFHRQDLEWRHDWTESFRLTARYRRVVVTRDETLLGFWTVESPTELSGYYTRYHDSALQRNVQLVGNGSVSTGPVRHTYALGHDINRQRINFQGVQNIGGFNLDAASPDFSAVVPEGLALTRRYNHERQRDRAWWLADRLSIDDSRHLSLGWRRTAYRIDADRTGTGLKPAKAQSASAYHLGFNQALAPGLRTFLAHSEGFEPNRGADRTGAYLPAQRSRQMEWGLHWTKSPMQSLQASLFRIDVSHLPLTDPADRTALISSGERRVQGLQVQGRWALAPWELAAQAHWQDMTHRVKTSDGQGDRLPGVAARSAGGLLQLDLGATALALPVRLSASLSAVGERYADAENTTRVPGYAVWGLGAWWAVSKAWEWSAGLSNVADHRYVEAVTALDDVAQGPRREAWTRLTVGF